MMIKNKILILIPTYNEKNNVEEILSQINCLNLSVDILFIDDNSPDFTGKLLDEISLKNNNIFVIHRPKKLGIGSAHILGIKWAFKNEYEYLITMDCDLSHTPKYILDFISKSKEGDIIVGSRFILKKSIKTWNFYRRYLTRLGHIASRIFLKMPYDSTGAFRLYSLKNISPYFINCLQSKGYSFFFESLFVLNQNKYKIVEIPIHLPARVYGSSKQKFKDAFHSLFFLFYIKLNSIFFGERFVISKPFNPDSKSKIIDPQNWDNYWLENRSKIIYDLIAKFYRKFIIKPSLNYFIFKNFITDSKLLHAGCGSGQVDVDINKKMNITGLDISPVALSLYKKTNVKNANLLHGSILNIPVANNCFDGVYNLGVMEHFNEHEIKKILQEFFRVLKPGGKIILFWPPKFGISVIFLKFIHIILNLFLKNNISLHPPEITKVRSKKQIENYFNQSGFKLKSYYFGFRDLFTQVAIMGEKINEK